MDLDARFWAGMFWDFFSNSMGCLCTLGWSPSPIALLMVRAIFRWFTGRNPVSSLCLIRPKGVMYSEMTEKF